MRMEIGYTRLILAECERRGVLRNQAAYILATAWWETAKTMNPVIEAFWKDDAWRRKNLRYYPWYGRGFVQLTWRDNYIKAGKALGVNLTTDPNRALDPKIAAQILVAGMMGGWFTGKKVSDYITISQSDFINARRIVNGMDKAGEIAAIARDYNEVLTNEGYGIKPAPVDHVPAVRPSSFWADFFKSIASAWKGKA